MPLFFIIVAFRSNNLFPQPQTLDEISEDDVQLCDIFEPLFLCVHEKPLLPLFISEQRSKNVNVVAKLCPHQDVMHHFLTTTIPNSQILILGFQNLPKPLF